MFMTEQFLNFFDGRYFIDSNCDLRSKSSSRKVDTMKVFRDYSDWCTEGCITSDAPKTDIDEFVKQKIQQLKDDQRSADSYSYIPENSIEYVKDYIKKHQNKDWRIDSAFRMIERMKNGIPVNSTLNDLTTAIYVQVIREGNQKKFKQNEIKAALEEYASLASLSAVTSIAEQIAYDASCVDKAELFLKTLYDEWKIAQPYDIFKDAFLHFSWQCKRKLLGLSVTWDLMLNFYGGTGIGKTTMVSAIGSVFRDFAIISTLTEVLDTERQVKKLSDCYFINLDELTVGAAILDRFGNDDGMLSRAQKVAFKKLMSQKKARTRNMGTQSQSSQRYTFSFVASSNTHLADVMYDPTTMRRYFELECQASNIQDFSKLEKAKTLITDFWKSVDEHNEKGYLYPGSRSWNAVQEIRAKYYPSNTTTEAWLRESSLAPCLSHARLPKMDLYHSYRSFCTDHGRQPKSDARWMEDIAHIMPSAIVNDLLCLRKVEAESNPPTTTMEII